VYSHADTLAFPILDTVLWWNGSKRENIRNPLGDPTSGCRHLARVAAHGDPVPCRDDKGAIFWRGFCLRLHIRSDRFPPPGKQLWEVSYLHLWVRSCDG